MVGQKSLSPTDLPALFLDQMRQLLRDEYPDFSISYQTAAQPGFRINTNKLSLEAYQSINPFQLTPLSWCSTGFTISDEAQAGKHPYHAAGLYYLQEPSTMAAAEILAAQPGDRVLDLCAAPGGKTTHLASLMHNQGLLVANEIHPQRVWELAENLERWGARNTIITNETPARLAEHFGAFFDRVLVDAPCSGEGMFRKSATARRDWSPALVEGCAIRQQDILQQAARLVKAGGWLAYSTCTFNPVENEAVIDRFLDQHADFELCEIKPAPGYSPGRPEWVTGMTARPELARAIRLWPQLAPAEGHFVALLRRNSAQDQLDNDAFSTKRTHRTARRPRGDLNGSDWGAFQAFCQATLNPEALDLSPEQLVRSGSYLYAVQPGLPPVTGLKVIHPGWWLGTFKNNLFVPSHALALGINADHVQRRLDCTAQSREVAAYLRGETLAGSQADGWLLVCVDGYPLGWGKNTHGVVKNHYPRGLRS